MNPGICFLPFLGWIRHRYLQPSGYPVLRRLRVLRHALHEFRVGELREEGRPLQLHGFNQV